MKLNVDIVFRSLQAQLLTQHQALAKHMFVTTLEPSGHYMYRQFNIQQFYVLPTQCIYVVCVSENKQRLFPYTALTDWFV